MRVTFLTHTTAKGGSNAMLLQMRDYLRGRGWETSILSGSEDAEGMLDDCDLVLPKPHEKWRDRMANYQAAIEATTPDVVWSMSGKAEFEVLQLLKCVRVRHLFSLEEHEYANIPFWLPQMHEHAEGMTANTPDVLKQIHEWGIREPRHLLAPYRFDERYERAPNVQPRPDREHVEVCFVGRLEPFQKRADWLANLFFTGIAAQKDIHFHVYGEGPELEPLKTRLREIESDVQVHFHGWVDTETLLKRLPEHDIFFLCSRWEGLPVAMVQAMLCGLACVVPHGNAGMSHALESGGGWLYEAANEAVAGQALVQAVAKRDELDARRKQAQAIAREKFSGTVVDGQLESLVKRLETLKPYARVVDVAHAKPIQAVPTSVLWKRRLRKLLGRG